MDLWDRFIFNLSKTGDKLKLFILASGTLLFLLVATVGGISLTMSPSFCNLCHKAMNPEYVTWKYSSHSQITCVECHIKPRVVNILLEKMVATKYLYVYLTGSFEKEIPIKMKKEISNEQCERCHSIKTRNFSLSGDLITPHEKHMEKGVSCIKCHSGVAHGNIYSRKAIEVEDDVSAWSDIDGEKNMTSEFTRPDMDTCVACHISPAKFGIKDVESVTWACEACHKSIFTPKSHVAPTWTEVHGVDAEKDIKGCASCHAIGIKSTFIADGVTENKLETGTQAKDFAWKSEFCSKCHAKKPKNHQNRENWMPNHRNVVAVKQMKNCLACHSINKVKPGDKLIPPAKELACNNCHWFK